MHQGADLSAECGRNAPPSGAGVHSARTSGYTLRMVAANDRAVVERFKRLAIARGAPVDRVILFGSRARGDCDPDSDYDVLVVVERLDPAIRRVISDCAWEAGFDDCLVITPVVIEARTLYEGPMRSSLLLQAVREEGVPI